MIRCTMAKKHTVKSVEQFQQVLDALIPNEQIKVEFGIDSYLVTRIHPNLFPRAFLCENVLSGCAKVFDSIELIDGKNIALTYENKHIASIEL